MKYNLGGRGKGTDYIHVNLEDDCDIKHDILDLDGFIKKDGVVDEFFLEHTLEHVPIPKYKQFLLNMQRKLKVGGEIKIIHTDAGYVIKLWIDGKLPFRSMKKTLFPPADYVAWNPLMSHQNMWTDIDLAKDFKALGFDAYTFDAGEWQYDLRDEFYPEIESKYWGTPIKNLGVLAVKI